MSAKYTCTESSLRDVIARHGGVLAAGVHDDQYADPAGPLCVLEAHAACLVEAGVLTQITDDPVRLGRPDYRPLNDGPWSSRAVATPHLIRLHVAYDGWAKWPEARRQRVVQRIVLGLVRETIAELPGLSEPIRARCRAVTDLAAARAAAAETAEAATAGAVAAWAAWAAAVAATCVETLEEADTILIREVNRWIAAAEAELMSTTSGDGEGKDG